MVEEADATIADQLERVKAVLGVTAPPAEAQRSARDGNRCAADTAEAAIASPGAIACDRDGKKRHAGGRPKGATSGRQRRGHDRTCDMCGKAFQGTGRQTYCSGRCRGRAYLERQAEAATNGGSDPRKHEKVAALEPEPVPEAPHPRPSRPPRRIL